MLLDQSSKTWRTPWRGRAAAGAAALLTFAATVAFARPLPSSAYPRLSAVDAQMVPGARAFAGSLSLDEAVAQAEKRYNAKVVKAETKQEGGKTVYELRLLSDDGRVWTIRVDAATGAGL